MFRMIDVCISARAPLTSTYVFHVPEGIKKTRVDIINYPESMACHGLADHFNGPVVNFTAYDVISGNSSNIKKFEGALPTHLPFPVLLPPAGDCIKWSFRPSARANLTREPQRLENVKRRARTESWIMFLRASPELDFN
jgi:hypothetical protein